jgi:hypothetical protein
MHQNEECTLIVAEVVRDAAGKGGAISAGDLDEARFRARLAATEPHIVGLLDVALAAVDLGELLGPVDTDYLPYIEYESPQRISK